MVIRLLNLLGENAIGGYYLAMNIFWSFLLVPVLALSESSKVLIANYSGDIYKVRRLWYTSLLIGVIILLIWLIMLPLWRSFAGLLNPNVEIVNLSFQAMLLLIVPYMLFALNTITDSIFYGTGKTKYQAYQTIITNGVVYGGAFLTYLTGLWLPTFGSIMILFGVGIIVDSIMTVFYAFRVLFPHKHALAVEVLA